MGKLADPPKGTEENLCADAGYIGKDIRKSMERLGYVAHAKGRNVEADAKREEGVNPSRWCVEACRSWMKNFRKLHERYEMTHRSYFGSMHAGRRDHRTEQNLNYLRITSIASYCTLLPSGNTHAKHSVKYIYKQNHAFSPKGGEEYLSSIYGEMLI